MVITIDSREPWPHPWESHIPPGWNFERGTLETGDIAPLSPKASETADPSPLTPPVPNSPRSSSHRQPSWGGNPAESNRGCLRRNRRRQASMVPRSYDRGEGQLR